jgi:hypothetical protein
LLTSPCGAKLGPHLPFVDECIAFEAPWVRHGADDDEFAGTSTAAEWRLLQRLADGRFDAAIVFTSCTQSALPGALLCRQAGIPLRLAHCRENPYRLLSDWLADTDVIGDGMRHEVERQLALVGSVGLVTGDSRLRFTLRAEDREHAALRSRSPEWMRASLISWSIPVPALHRAATRPTGSAAPLRHCTASPACPPSSAAAPRRRKRSTRPGAPWERARSRWPAGSASAAWAPHRRRRPPADQQHGAGAPRALRSARPSSTSTRSPIPSRRPGACRRASSATPSSAATA